MQPSMCVCLMDVRMQEWLPPHRVPQNVEAEPAPVVSKLGSRRHPPGPPKGHRQVGPTRIILPVPVSHRGFHVGFCALLLAF